MNRDANDSQCPLYLGFRPSPEQTEDGGFLMAAAVRSLAWLELNINYVCQVYNAAFSPCHFTSFEPRFKYRRGKLEELRILNFPFLSVLY